MNTTITMYTKKSQLLLLTTLLCALPVYGESDLGTPAQVWSAAPSTDIESLVRNAYPRFSPPSVEERINRSIARAVNGIDQVVVRDVPSGLRTIGVNPAEGRIVGDSFIGKLQDFHFDRVRGAFMLVDKREDLKLIDERTALSLMPRLKGQHLTLLDKMGIKHDEIMHLETSMIKVQTAGGASGRIDKVLPAKVDEVVTIGIRKIGDVLVEDSYFRVSSSDPAALRSMAVKWPAFRFHPLLKKMEMKSADVVQREIMTLIKARTRGEALKLQMAIVYRPVKVSGRLVHIPAMKVGMMPQNNEAGEIFYVDLHKIPLAYEDVAPVADLQSNIRLIDPIIRPTEPITR